MPPQDLPSDDRIRWLRTAGWIWLVYLAALMLTDQFIMPPRQFNFLYFIENGLIALAFLGLAHWRAAQRLLGEVFTPLMIAWISALPILTNHLLVPILGPGPLSNVEGQTLRLLPVLFIALILTAWAYRWPEVVVFSLATAALDIFILLMLGQDLRRPINPTYFVVVVRTVSFLVVGNFISRLITRLRQQQESLWAANARLTHYASTLEQLTITRERNRLARELHDTLAHTLSGLSVNLETVKAYWDVDEGTARALLDKSLAVTRAGIEETRRALKSLRASPLEDLGLQLALERLMESAAARGGLRTSIHLPAELPPLSPVVEQSLFRVAQEAVENALHHANAQSLCMRLEQAGERLRLTVQDDGLGFNPQGADQGATGHYGLVGMRERAQLVGGELKIDSRPGGGTRVELIL